MTSHAQAMAFLGNGALASEHAYSASTARLFASNWRWWTAFCESRCTPSAPPFDANTIKAAVLQRAGENRARATIDALLNTLSAAARIAGHPCPTHGQEFRDWLKVIRRKELSSRQRQAKGMTYPDLHKILSTLDTKRAGDARDAALLSSAFDGLLRSNEIASLRWEDVIKQSDGSGVVLLRRSKTDQEGQGRQVFLSGESMALLDTWASFGRRTGPIFTALRADEHAEGLNTRSIRRIFRARGFDAGVVGLSGHSARVGAAQDATAANVPLQSLMVAGRWSNPKMPARYGEEAHAALLGRERIAAIRRLHGEATASTSARTSGRSE